jgi:serine phosphatase RsbU (regulator of sigma subunit)
MESSYLSDPKSDLALNLRIDSICDLNLEKELSPKEGQFFLKAKASATNIIGVNYYYVAAYEKAISYYGYSAHMHEELGNLKGQANAVNNIGVVYFRLNQFDKALEFYNKGLAFRLVAKDTMGIAGSYRNLATAYKKKGDYFKAVDYLSKENQLNHLIKDSVSIATGYMEIGTVNFDLENYETTKMYFQKAENILLKKKALRELTRAYNGLGACCEKTYELDSAIYYYDLSIEIAIDLKDAYSLSIATLNKGIIFILKGDDIQGEKMVKDANRISKEIEDHSGYINSLCLLGQILNDRSEYKQAELIGEEILKTLDTVKVDLNTYIDVYEMIYTAAKNLQNSRKALKFHELYIEYKDSLINNSNHKLLLQKEFESQVEAAALKTAEFIKVKDAQLSAEKSENNRRRQQGYYLVGGLCLASLFGLFVLNRYRLTRRQNRVIEEQKKVVEQAHEEIRDSIVYAKRIQSALLPPMSLVKKHISEAFILYLPKDVVAGDFYWMEQVKEKTIIAAADCTGHGVPGALVSVLCSNALSRSTREYGLTNPGEILNKTREIVIEKFSRSEENVNDGMDVALVSLEKIDATKTRVKYAGANNPIWILKKEAKEIIEIKATKQPIGNYFAHKDFQTHVIELAKGDQFFIFSDGFADQFGGERGKKLKNKAFKEILLSIKDLSADEQKEILFTKFENWRGTFEQIDDVLVIGAKI